MEVWRLRGKVIYQWGDFPFAMFDSWRFPGYEQSRSMVPSPGNSGPFWPSVSWSIVNLPFHWPLQTFRLGPSPIICPCSKRSQYIVLIEFWTAMAWSENSKILQNLMQLIIFPIIFPILPIENVPSLGFFACHWRRLLCSHTWPRSMGFPCCSYGFSQLKMVHCYGKWMTKSSCIDTIW